MVSLTPDSLQWWGTDTEEPTAEEREAWQKTFSNETSSNPLDTATERQNRVTANIHLQNLEGEEREQAEAWRDAFGGEEGGKSALTGGDPYRPLEDGLPRADVLPSTGDLDLYAKGVLALGVLYVVGQALTVNANVGGGR